MKKLQNMAKMKKPKRPKHIINGHKGLAALLKYLIELQIYKKVNEENTQKENGNNPVIP